MNQEVDASIDTLSSIGSEVLQASGPCGQVYDLQLQAETAQRRLEWVRDRLYEAIEQENRADRARGGFGSLTSTYERVERDPEVVAARQEFEALTSQVAQAQAEIGGIVFLPPVESLPKIEKKLAALGRKATVLGTEAITLTVSEEKLLLNYPYAEDPDTHRGYSADFEHVFVVLKGATPKVPDFEFLATITPTEAGNVVKRIPAIAYGVRHNLDWGHHEGEERSSAAGQALESIDLTRFHSTGDICEHCHKDRRRSDLYVVYNEKTGEAIQVGRTCLRDYMGTNDPERVLKALEQYLELMRSIRASQGEIPALSTEDFMIHAATMVRSNAGYVRGLGYKAYGNYFRRLRQAKDKKTGEPLWVEPSDHDAHEGARMLKWVREEWDESGEFATNVKLSLSGEIMNPKLVGYAGAAFVAYTKWVEGAAKRKAVKAQEQANAEKQHIGTVGQREVFTLTVKTIKWIEDRYGYTYGGQPPTKPLLIMADPEGNEVKWFASDLPSVADKAVNSWPVEGGTYEVKATVKRHEEDDRWGKSTVVNRCVFQETISEAEGEND